MKKYSLFLLTSLIMGISAPFYIHASTEILHDEIVDIDANTTKLYDINLTGNTTFYLYIDFEIRSGPNMQIFVVNQSNYVEYNETDGNPEYILLETSIREFNWEIKLGPEGLYYFGMMNSVNETARVYIRLVSSTSSDQESLKTALIGGAIGLGAALGVIAAILGILEISDKRKTLRRALERKEAGHSLTHEQQDVLKKAEKNKRNLIVKCSNCGKRVLKRDKRCSSCGEILEISSFFH